MLARASSDAGTRLRRSKSTSTVQRHAPPVIEPVDADVAQQHAIAAATVAFARSHAHMAVERKTIRSIEHGRSKSTASRKSLTSQGSHFPQRELSVRSVPGQRSTQTSNSSRLSAAPAAEKFPVFEPTTQSDRPTSATRPLSAQPSITFREYARPPSQPKSHRQSAVSSIASQQIRKARSMYYASSVQTGSPIARPPAKYLTTPPPISTSPALSTAPTSYIPTRSTGPSPLAEMRATAAVAPREIVDAARDQCLQGFQQQQQQRSIKHKPSLFLASFKKRQDKTKDKAKRLSSIVTSVPSTNYSFAEDSTVDITVSDFMPQSEVKDRRSFSGSLKKRIKRVFRRTSAKSPSLPVQQIEASRQYFNDTTVHPTDDHGFIPSPDEHILRRARSRTPSLDGGHPRPIRSASRSSSKGSARSNRSLHSETNASYASASRVTSWDTSASGETFSQRALKRLTVIHEAKDSIGSMADGLSSASAQRKSLPMATFSAFKDPMCMESVVEEASTPPVDPKRVFSALMREIDASKVTEASTGQAHTPGAESDVFESRKTKEMHSSNQEPPSSVNESPEPLYSNAQRSATGRPGSVAAQSVQSKKSSIKLFGQAIRSTIRTVTPGEYQSSPFHDAPYAALSKPNTPSSATSSGPREDQESRSGLFKRLRVSRKRSATLNEAIPTDTSTPTATQIELRVAKAKNRWQTPLNESLTPSFPRETDRLYTVVDFSQQRPMDQGHATTEQPVSPQSPPAQRSKTMQTPMSPSVYSRNTDGASILPNDSVISVNNPYEFDRQHQGGSAVILTSQSVRSYVIGTPSPNRRSSTRSSRDWKAWLSHEVSGIETASQEDITIHHQYATPSEKHLRHATQTVRTSHTDSEDTTVVVRGSFDTSTPRAEPETSTVAGTEQQIITSSKLDLCLEFSKKTPEQVGQDAEETKKLSSERQDQLSLAPISTPMTRKDHSTPTYGSSSGATQAIPGTPTSPRMNERFPFLDTGRRSGSNNSSRSRLSKSPTSSVGSSTKPMTSSGREIIYSDVSVPVSSSTTVDVLGTAVGADITQRRKENITPSFSAASKRPNISPLGLVQRPKSLQPLSSAAVNRSPVSTVQPAGSAVDANLPKHPPSPAETVVARPGLRVTIRPLSPEKLSRRPRSAIDLRNNPSPRPASEIRRSPLRPSVFSREHSTPDVGMTNDTHPRDGSVTPGQRMAEIFLKERKSATVLERGVRKSPGKFVREDTPAFL